MDKEELMGYCWCRGFNYDNLLNIADRSRYKDVMPTRDEYEAYRKREDKKMQEYFEGDK